MSIRFPNSFQSHTRSALLRFAEPIDLKPLAAEGLPAELACQLITRECVVSLAHTQSTVSQIETIAFREVLFKVPVRLGGGPYLFPVLTIVDSEFSLIRGFLLGFHKRFIQSDPGDPPWSFESAELSIDLSSAEVERSMEIPEHQGCPFVLWSDFSAAGGVRSHGLATLAPSEYVQTRSTALKPPLGDARLLNRDGEVAAAWEVEDRFILNEHCLVPVQFSSTARPN